MRFLWQVAGCEKRQPWPFAKQSTDGNAAGFPGRGAHPAMPHMIHSLFGRRAPPAPVYPWNRPFRHPVACRVSWQRARARGDTGSPAAVWVVDDDGTRSTSATRPAWTTDQQLPSRPVVARPTPPRRQSASKHLVGRIPAGSFSGRILPGHSASGACDGSKHGALSAGDGVASPLARLSRHSLV